jgi:hypothetical protein
MLQGISKLKNDNELGIEIVSTRVTVHHSSGDLLWVPDREKNVGYPVNAEAPGLATYVEWEKALLIHEMEHRLIRHFWRKLLKESTSWLQVLKAFPEMCEILIGALSLYISADRGYYYNNMRRHVIPKLREAWRQQQKRKTMGGRITSMPIGFRMKLQQLRPLTTTVCAQAALLPHGMSGNLDSGPFSRTTIVISTREV